MKLKFNGLTCVLIWSENWEALANWYEQTLELKPVEEIRHPQDTGRLFEVAPGAPWIWIGQHDRVKGKNMDADRHMFNLEVDSVEGTHNELLARGVTCIAPPFKAPTFDKYFSTFADPDGNLFQVVGKK